MNHYIPIIDFADYRAALKREIELGVSIQKQRAAHKKSSDMQDLLRNVKTKLLEIDSKGISV